MAWHAGPLIGFDLETTGTDPREARIVTAAVIVTTAGGAPMTKREWLADPGVRIPAETVAIHGITDARAAAEGRPAPEVADEIADELVRHWQAGSPIVAYNAAFDLSLLAAELDRHGLPSLADRMGGAEPGPVIDPLTIDRAVDRYRKGKRTLEAVCVEYGVVLESAHDAAADALAAVQVAHALAERHARVAGATVWELHRWQVTWYADWAAGYRHWLQSQGRPGDDIDAIWPLREPVPRT